MGRLKTFRKYIIWIIAFYIFSIVCTYVGLNATYKNISYSGDLPNGITVKLSQATTVNGRIYGEVTSTESNNLNGKYIKVQIYSKKDQLLGEKYLEINDINLNEPKKFKVNFTADNVKYYTIDVLDNTEETQEKISIAKKLWDGVFTDEELKGAAIIALILGLTFLV